MNTKDMEILDEWINQISLENSDSKKTRDNYERNIIQFCDVTKVSLSDIANEWNSIHTYGKEKVFGKKVRKLLRVFQTYLEKQDYTKATIGAKLVPIYSFFNRYLEANIRAILPQATVTYHNRPIEKHEIEAILGQSNLRNSLAYYLMLQGGLRPHTIARLKYKDIKEDYEANTIPLRIVVRKEIAKGKYANYYTFVGQETVNLLHRMLKTRETSGILNDECYIIQIRGTKANKSEHSNPKNYSQAFQKTAMKLKLQAKGTKGKPNKLRLYCLRKYFRNRASSSGLDYVHFWMGHKLKNNDEHYFDKDTVEVHRERYRKFVLPQVRIFESQVVYKKVMSKEDLVNFLNTEEGKEAISEIVNKEIQRAFNNAKTTELSNPKRTKTELTLFP